MGIKEFLNIFQDSNSNQILTSECKRILIDKSINDSKMKVMIDYDYYGDYENISFTMEILKGDKKLTLIDFSNKSEVRMYTNCPVGNFDIVGYTNLLSKIKNSNQHFFERDLVICKMIDTACSKEGSLEEVFKPYEEFIKIISKDYITKQINYEKIRN